MTAVTSRSRAAWCSLSCVLVGRLSPAKAQKGEMKGVIGTGYGLEAEERSVPDGAQYFRTKHEWQAKKKWAEKQQNPPMWL